MPMLPKTAQKFCLAQVKDLGFDPADSDVANVLESAIEFAEIASRDEVKQYIEESLSYLRQG